MARIGTSRGRRPWTRDGLEFVEAAGMRNRLLTLCTDCSSLDIAVAFLSRRGYRALEPVLKRIIERDCHVRVVVGLSNVLRITDKKAVQDLLDLAEESIASAGGPSIELRYYNNVGFHPKILIFRRGKRGIDAIVGSSNMTMGGQQNNTEANVLLTSPPVTFVSSINDFYKRLWKGADEFKDDTLRKYKGRRKIKSESEAGDEDDGHSKSSLHFTKLPPGPPIDIISFGSTEDMAGMSDWWKVAPGSSGRAWSAVWFPEIEPDSGKGVIAIGWEEVGNLSKFRDALEAQNYNSLERVVKRTAKSEEWRIKRWPYGFVWRNQKAVNYVVNTLANFAGWGKDPIEEGHGVIAYSNSRVYAIGRVTGGYEFREDLPYHNHTRGVQWFHFREDPGRASSRIINSIGVGGWQTMRHLPDAKSAEAAWNLRQWNMPA